MQPLLAQNPAGLAGARWIGEPEKQFAEDSLLFGDHPASLFRREFVVKGPVRSAKLSITAAGY